jgi:molybdenum cofactor synthesis domain-containing protein
MNQSPASPGPAEPLLSPDEALATILRHVEPLGGEVVELSAALHRVLHADVVSGRPLPPWDNSAMDGYAVRAAEIVPASPLPVRGVIAAGQKESVTLSPGTALRIMTGAPIPSGADAVIMREEAIEQDGAVRFSAAPQRGQHVRRAGEDLEAGEVVLKKGAPLQAGELGLLAALGRTLVEVHRRPEVAIVSTGDELVAADCAPGPGQIVNSNAHALCAQIIEAGGLPRVLPIARDDRQALRAAFIEALRSEVVVSSGGVSVGEFDYVREVLAELSAVEEFSRVAMKPGKPLTFSRLEPTGPGGRRRLLFGLPGNPASSMVSFELFVRPALRRLQGHVETGRPRIKVRLETPVTPDKSRLHFARARVRCDGESGIFWAAAPQKQGSGMLRSMVGVNALLHVPPGSLPLAAGTTVWATLFGDVCR